MNASGERMAGVEALCRWNHPVRGEVPPVDFIPIAERSELIIPLGAWVLRKACLEGRAWTGLTVAVNVSPLQFRRQDFVEVVERILAETGLDPHRLELELTESTLLGNVDDAEKAMQRLKARGVRFALDDFGTGYSSLLYLRRFPFDRIKIDRSFVRSIESAADAASIVHAIVSLGRGLGMKVTAEGVETAEQQLFLRAAGVHSMQGFRFGRPSPAEAITERLQQATFTPMQAAASLRNGARPCVTPAPAWTDADAAHRRRRRDLRRDIRSGSAHRFGKDVHFECDLAPVSLRHRGDAHERALLDVGKRCLDHAGDLRIVGERHL